MKNWWLNANAREKQMVILGGIALSLILLYEITWAPLANTVDTLRDHITNNQTLLAWMQSTDTRIQQLNQNASTSNNTSTTSLLSLLQTELDQTALNKNVILLQQSENDTVELRLQKASFDNVMKWLINLCQTHHVTIVQASVTPSQDVGIVDADFKLQS